MRQGNEAAHKKAGAVKLNAENALKTSLKRRKMLWLFEYLMDRHALG